MVSPHQSKNRRASGASVSVAIQLHPALVREQLQGPQKSRPPPVAQHPRQRGDRPHSVSAMRSGTRAPRTACASAPPNSRCARDRCATARGCGTPMARPPLPRFGGRLDLPQAAQFFRQNGALGSQLRFVRRVLIMAAAAAPEIGAWRGGPIGRWFQQSGARARTRPGFSRSMHAHPLPGQHIRRQRHAARPPAPGRRRRIPAFRCSLRNRLR